MGDRWELLFRSKKETFKNFLGGRKAIIKALTDDVEELCRQCDDEYLGLYGFPNGKWQVNLSLDVPVNLPHSKLYKLPHQEEDKPKWLAKVAADSDTWLLALTFALCGYYCYDKDWREWLFNKINDLPTIYEEVTCNDKNQEVATEKAKKRVKNKSTVSGHCKTLSNSEVVLVKTSPVPIRLPFFQRMLLASFKKAKKRVKDKSTDSGHYKTLSNSEVLGMSSSILVKELKREGKKAITKREPLMRSALQTRSKALGIQTRAQTRKSQIKKIS